MSVHREVPGNKGDVMVGLPFFEIGVHPQQPGFAQLGSRFFPDIAAGCPG